MCKHASLIPLNKPIQAFGVSYGAQTDLGVSLTAPGQRFAAQCGCFLIVAPTQDLEFRHGHIDTLLQMALCRKFLQQSLHFDMSIARL